MCEEGTPLSNKVGRLGMGEVISTDQTIGRLHRKYVQRKVCLMKKIRFI